VTSMVLLGLGLLVAGALGVALHEVLMRRAPVPDLGARQRAGHRHRPPRRRDGRACAQAGSAPEAGLADRAPRADAHVDDRR
jgi:hypothetical protein